MGKLPKYISNLAYAALVVLFVLSIVPVMAGNPEKKKDQPAKDNVYNTVWKKVRPRSKSQSTGGSGAVAGLRGDEKGKGKFLKPYWKGEKKGDAPDIRAFLEASKLMDAKDFLKAEQMLLKFITQFPKSTLMPKVRLALAVCYAQLGKKDDASRVLTEWLKDYPQNELAPEAKAMLAELKK